MRSLRAAGGVLFCFALAACEEVEQVVDRFRDFTPHEAYAESLRAAGLVETALGRDWLRAAGDAVRAPHVVALPFREEGYLPPEEPAAVGYRFSLLRGQVLTIRAQLDAASSSRLFMDFFRVPEDAGDPLRPIQDADTVSAGVWTYEPNREGEYLLRIQPELLRGGRYSVALTLDAALAFPVQGGNPSDIGSGFGADRDGGARSHHGVDIFAARGTPALAAASGVVSRVQDTSIGGKVVWIQDDRRSARLYYAHLDSQLVARGQRVQVGDTVGFVGNTGNARTTPPHLHFGIYMRGPTDPDPFIRPPRRQMPALLADLEMLGAWARLSDATELRSSPEAQAEVKGQVAAGAPLRILGGSGLWYRVRLPDGQSGWVAARRTEAADRPLGEWVVARPSRVRSAPVADAPVVTDVSSGISLPVFGTFAGYTYVQTPGGHRGWVSQGG
jgi:murein DD-endopeptidase MepM/ murein hydrolase activator NlpD/SH3-like domain-containing protein